MIKLRKFFLFVGLLCIIFVGCTTESTPPPTQSPDSVSIHLGWFPGAGFLGFYAAVEQGFFADENIDVTLIHLSDFSEAEGIAQRVSDREIDFAMGTGVAVPQRQLEGLDIIPFATLFQFGGGTFFARADSGIITPADFEGRSVVVKTPIWQQRLELLLASVGLTLDDVEQVEEGSLDYFIDGNVDIGAGSVANEVVQVRLAGVDIVTFPTDEYGIEAVTGALYTATETLAENEELAVRFMRAVLNGYNWAFENPSDAVDLMLDAYPELAENSDFHYASLTAYIPLIKVPGVSIGTIDCEAWLTYAEFDELDSTDNICTTQIMDQVEVLED